MEGRCTTAQVIRRILLAWEGVEEWVSCASHHRYHFLQSQGPRGKDRSLRLNKQKTKTANKHWYMEQRNFPSTSITQHMHGHRVHHLFGGKMTKNEKRREKKRKKELISPKNRRREERNNKRKTSRRATGTQCVPSVFAKTVESPYICRWQETVQGCFIQYFVEAPIEIYPTCSSSFSWDPVSVTAKKFLNSW